MGAAAGKHFQSDRTKYAAAVLEAVKNYELNHSGEFEQDTFNYQPQLFKRHVHLAAAEAKRHGKDIDSSLAQLTDHDLEKLWGYIEKRRHDQVVTEPEQTSAATTTSLPASQINTQSMTVEEFTEEDPQNNDETTSLLSYGDDEQGGDNDSELDLIEESDGHLLLQKSLSKSLLSISKPIEIVEDLEENDMDDSHVIERAMRVFPSDEVSPVQLPKIEKDHQPLMEEVGIAEALAKIWDMDDIKDGPYSPFTPKSRQSRNNSDGNDASSSLTPKLQRKNSYKDRNKKIDEGNERLMGLQRQKVMSFTQNAQLEREVEALQKQLEKIEEFERSMDNSTSNLTSPHQLTLHSSMQSSASTIYTNSASKAVYQNSSHEFQTPMQSKGSINTQDKHWTPKYSYIYPIDEESIEISNSNRNKHPDSSIIKKAKHRGKGLKENAQFVLKTDEESSAKVTDSNKLAVVGIKPAELEERSRPFIGGKKVSSSSQEDRSIASNENNVKSHRYNNRRKVRSGNSSGGESDDSTSNSSFHRGKQKVNSDKLLPSAGDNIASPRVIEYETGSSHVIGLQDVASVEKNLYSKNTDSLQGSPIRGMEARKARNTIGNESNNKNINFSPNGKNDSISEEENGNVAKVVSSKDYNSNKVVVRRRHSMDGALSSENGGPTNNVNKFSDQLLQAPPGVEVGTPAVDSKKVYHKKPQESKLIYANDDQLKIENSSDKLDSLLPQVSELKSRVVASEGSSKATKDAVTRKRRQRVGGVNAGEKFPSEDDLALNKEELVNNGPWTPELDYRYNTYFF